MVVGNGRTGGIETQIWGVIRGDGEMESELRRRAIKGKKREWSG